jgi:protein MAK11
VKAIDLMDITLEGGKTKTILVTASSDGLINIHDTNVLDGQTTEVKEGPATFEPIGSYDTSGTRLTCVSFADQVAPTQSISVAGLKRSLSDDEEEDADIDSDSEST